MPVKRTERDGSVTRQFYDTDGQLIKIIRPNEYARAGENGKGVQYTYDAQGRVFTVIRADGTIQESNTYDAEGNLIHTQDGMGNGADMEYDLGGRRTKIATTGKASQQYAYDVLGNITGITDGTGNRTVYILDNWGRIVEIRQADGNSECYGYDYAGNLLKDDKAQYEYDAFNCNTRVETFNGNVQINRYDAEELRHEMEENGKLVSFIFRGDEVVAEESQEDRIRYIRTSVLLASDAESARTYYHYASDEMSSVTHVVNSEKEETLNRYEYDAWGNLTTCEEKVHNRFKFNDQQYDPVSQQYYLRARYYNLVIVRFTQEDSYNVDGLNLYAYCKNNPVYYVNPSGNICDSAANRIMDKFSSDGLCNASRNEQKKLASYLQNKKNHGEILTSNEARILNQINNFTAESRYGLRMGSYDKTKKPSGTQLHHVSQDAAFGGVILKGEGLTVALHGDVIFGVGSEHYKAHSSLEMFWNDYRKGGIHEGVSPTVGQYNRALYDSMINAGLSDKQAAYVVSRAYEQQRDHGLSNTFTVPRVPNPTHQQK